MQQASVTAHPHPLALPRAPLGTTVGEEAACLSVAGGSYGRSRQADGPSIALQLVAWIASFGSLAIVLLVVRYRCRALH